MLQLEQETLPPETYFHTYCPFNDGLKQVALPSEPVWFEDQIFWTASPYRAIQCQEQRARKPARISSSH